MFYHLVISMRQRKKFWVPMRNRIMFWKQWNKLLNLNSLNNNIISNRYRSITVRCNLNLFKNVLITSDFFWISKSQFETRLCYLHTTFNIHRHTSTTKRFTINLISLKCKICPFCTTALPWFTCWKL